MTADPDADRRTLLRVVIALAIGIPVLVEALTFAGLIGNTFGGGGGDGGRETTGAGRSGVGVGDELLPETAPTERIVDGAVRKTGDGPVLELAIEVRNGADVPYALGLETVTTTAGAAVAGGASTGRVEPGERATVTGTWPLPDGARPATLTVVSTTYGEETRRRAVTVTLGKIPVRG